MGLGPGVQVRGGGRGRGLAASEVPGLFKLVSANIESLDARLPVSGEDPFATADVVALQEVRLSQARCESIGGTLK